MPTIPDVIECGESGSGSFVINADGTQSRAVQLRWLVGNVTGYDAAEARGKRLAPDTYRGHRRIRLEPQVVGGGWYQITAEYANGSIVLPPTPGCLGTFGTWAFELEQQTEHITQAYSDSRASPDDIIDPNAYITASVVGFPVAQIGGLNGATFVPPPEGGAQGPWGFVGGIFVPDFRGAIGVEVDQVRGTDVPRSSLSWTEVWHFPVASILKKRPPLKKLSDVEVGGTRERYEIEQLPLIKVFEKLAFHTNSMTFRGFEAGEVLMGTPRSSQINAGMSMASVTFTFHAKSTKRNFVVGDIKVPIQGGWDILDILYETASEATMTIKKPRVVYRCTVIPPGDFSELGIGDDLPDFALSGESLSHTFDDFVGRV
jgi:hypothetical protein